MNDFCKMVRKIKHEENAFRVNCSLTKKYILYNVYTYQKKTNMLNVKTK